MAPKYPLQQVLEVKKDRVQKAERVVDEKERALEIEQEKLKKVIAARDQVAQHKEDKVRQIDDAFKKGTTSDEVLQKKAYLKVVDEKLAAEEKKVQEQKEQVKKAEKNLEEAKEDLRQKRKEEEKIELHRQQWEKEQKIELGRQEAKEQDEIGQLLYESYKRKKAK